ncbi:hypothetical protein A6A25_11655 [Saccharothrix sp. CB00851]|nr:hypothetical protein A6A25_11655 [Saccharothrix sp. CB00851]
MGAGANAEGAAAEPAAGENAGGAAGEPLVVPFDVPGSVPLMDPLAVPFGVPLAWPFSVPFEAGVTGSNFVVAAATGGRLVAVIGSAVGHAGSCAAASGCMRIVGVSLVRWGWVGTWLDVTPRSCQNTLGSPVAGDQQKMSPHGLRVVVVVVLVVVVVGRRVVVVVGRAVVVVVTFDVVVTVAVVVVVLVPDIVVVVVVPDDLVFAGVVAVAVIVRLGCSLRLTTTISPPPPVGSRPRGALVMLPCAAMRAATAAPIKAPKASRPEPPNAVSILNDYRPHPSGSNPSGQLVPARHFGYRAGTTGAPVRRGSRSA